jgi:hypothetical protein
MRRCPEFRAEVEQADVEFLRANFAFIKDARSKEWTAAAWIAERRWPEMFARPEIQLNQINVAGSEVTISLSAADLSAMQEERARAIELLGRSRASTNGEARAYTQSEESVSAPDLDSATLAAMEAERVRAIQLLGRRVEETRD